MAQKMMDEMKDMPMNMQESERTAHAATGKVIKMDANTGVVTLAHDPVKSLNWPAMTMGFKVEDKTLLDKFIIGKTVDFEFIQADKGYIITTVK